MSRLDELKANFRYVLREEGAHAAAERLKVHARNYLGRLRRQPAPRDDMSDFVDVLFINGCDYSVPHPVRYRVDHQIEQLEAVGMTARKVDAWDLVEDHVRLARTFVIFRCPYWDFIEHFVELAHQLNKRVLYDIDDLVIDTAYTDKIKYLDTLSPEDRAGYDDGVRRMGRTMALCDGVITTTEQLALELRRYKETVFVNRNVASEEMLALSERAAYERDVLPGLAESEVPKEDRHRWELARRRRAERTGFSLGYFSGSITHNDDFQMILPAVVRLMRDYPDVKLHVVGELDLPEALEPFSDRVVRMPFSPWRRLPQMLSFVDVNLVPLEDTLFNRCKSENKWVEAALVKVPSVASNVGALADSITDGVNGVLCDNTADAWYEALARLHDDSDLRARLGRAAYDECSQRNVTCGTGARLARFLRSQERPNLAFVFPGLDISGGVLVALEHAAILQGRGVDVTLVAPDVSLGRWKESDGARLPVLGCAGSAMRGRFDKMVATMWTTLDTVRFYPNAGHRFYLVQNLETGFYSAGDPQRAAASRTYGLNPDVTYCTISPWCRDWLTEDFGQGGVRYAPNGIDLELFSPCERDWSGRIRILIEGDSQSEYKNVDESFAIVDLLDPERYEVWYLSYRGAPKPSYRVDKFLQAVPHEEVGDVYRQCHILLKTSVLESFSYPPLEMMATGGQVVVLRNGGNAAYLVDGENSLLFDRGEDVRAAALVESLVEDAGLRDRLRAGGLETARGLSWERIADRICSLYE